MKMTVIPIVIGTLGTIPKRIGIGTERLENKRGNGYHPAYCILKIG